MNRVAVCYIVHDDSNYLAESIASFQPVDDRIAFVSRVPWHDQPGDWERAGEIAFATFSYDPAGNTLLKWQQGTNPMTFTYDAANRPATLLQGSTVTTYTSDNTGNLTEENAAGSRTTYVYDNENRLVGVKFSGGTLSTYTFDGDGLRRSAFEAGGTLTTMIWDGTDYLGEV